MSKVLLSLFTVALFIKASFATNPDEVGNKNLNCSEETTYEHILLGDIYSPTRKISSSKPRFGSIVCASHPHTQSNLYPIFSFLDVINASSLIQFEEKLLKAFALGLNINHQTFSGLTLLHVAITYEVPFPATENSQLSPLEKVRWLIAHGANPSLYATIQGKRLSPLGCALLKHNLKDRQAIIDLLNNSSNVENLPADLQKRRLEKPSPLSETKHNKQ